MLTTAMLLTCGSAAHAEPAQMPKTLHGFWCLTNTDKDHSFYQRFNKKLDVSRAYCGTHMQIEASDYTLEGRAIEGKTCKISKVERSTKGFVVIQGLCDDGEKTYNDVTMFWLKGRTLAVGLWPLD